MNRAFLTGVWVFCFCLCTGLIISYRPDFTLPSEMMDCLLDVVSIYMPVILGIVIAWLFLPERAIDPSRRRIVFVLAAVISVWFNGAVVYGVWLHGIDSTVLVSHGIDFARVTSDRLLPLVVVVNTLYFGS